MRLAFVLDPLTRLDPTGDTSVALIEAAQELGHETWIVKASRLALIEARPYGQLRRIRVRSGSMEGVRWVAPEPWYEIDRIDDPIALESMDAVFVRTDPPLDAHYLWATWILDFIDPSSTIVINDPRGIRDANEKLFALRFPDLIPPTIVSADADEILEFVGRHGRTIAKPIDGHAGRGVVQLRTGDDNLRSLIELATARGTQPTVLQAWIDAAASGNKRILLWDGAVLGAVNRPMEPDDFRTGAPSEAADLTAREREIVDRLEPALRASGLWFVGLDTIGDYLIEVNVTSPGGIRQAIGLGMPEIARDLIRALEGARMHEVPPRYLLPAAAALTGAAINTCGW